METREPPFHHVLLVADERRSRVREVMEFLRGRTRLTVCPATREALASVETAHAPVDLVLLAPATRDELSASQVDQLLERFPLAHRLLLVDHWLEGETRSGRPWPGVARIYWDQLQPQWELAAHGWLSAADGRRALAWRPPTWTAEDSWVAPPHRELPPARGRVLVCAKRQEGRETLAQVCIEGGWEVVTRSSHLRLRESTANENVDAIVFDCPMNVAHWDADLRRLRERNPSSRIVVLVDFPRPQEVEAAREAGADWVLGKPYRIEELLAGLSMDGGR